MHTVLDIDLDFFVWPPAYWPPWSNRMPQDAFEHLASEQDVRDFLEKQCHLTPGNRLPSQSLTRHDEAFDVWRRWITEGTLKVPFRVVHVDAHSDLGLGGSGHLYLCTDLLAMDVDRRSEPARDADGMNEGNYLVFAVANRWISELTFVAAVEPQHIAAAAAENLREFSKLIGAADSVLEPDENRSPAKDLMTVHFQNCDTASGFLELKRYATRADASTAAGGRRCEELVIAREPQVPFTVTAGPDFNSTGFTHIVVAQSPRYTPESADRLLTVIGEYGAF